MRCSVERFGVASPGVRKPARWIELVRSLALLGACYCETHAAGITRPSLRLRKERLPYALTARRFVNHECRDVPDRRIEMQYRHSMQPRHADHPAGIVRCDEYR